MSKPIYYIESVKMDQSQSDMGTAVISCKEHPRCIEIYGNKVTLTTRIILVLVGLNE